MPIIARPDIHTLFHIDTDWFEKNGRDLPSELYDALCEECRVYYPAPADSRPVDRIHPQTAEVSKVDALWECIADHCGLKPTFITPTTPLTTGIFRALLANGNNPMSPEQLHKRVGKSNPTGILKVLMGAEIENGIVPVQWNGKPK
ncbi:MAG: hypothetical protein A2Z03_10105 [Chloroflexi bacterium RBG_16_56_8]|nr:MAG: hypothetical protein A2Z03_10105 [Chloroflexi bacterium RBG_16_56_8]